ncbi:MAG: DUF4349 domain-containing protein [Leifsonia sp.]
MKRIWGGVVVIVTVGMLLAGCTATSDGSASVGGTSAGGAVATKPQGSSGSVNSGASPQKADQLLTANRDVVTTGTITLTVADPIAAADSATSTVERGGGRVDSSTEQPAADGGKPGATLVLRIPADRLTTTLDTLKRLGTVDSVELKADDVTAQAKDVDGRITALQTSVDRLLELMSKATTTADLITIESTLSDRQAQLDSLKAQKAALDDQVSLSTITLQLRAKGTVVAAPAPTFWSGLTGGSDALVVTLNGLLVVLGVLLPWLVVVGVVGGTVWLIVRAVGRRRRGLPVTSTTTE